MAVHRGTKAENEIVCYGVKLDSTGGWRRQAARIKAVENEIIAATNKYVMRKLYLHLQGKRARKRVILIKEQESGCVAMIIKNVAGGGGGLGGINKEAK
jgi:hypothetical protein